MYIRGKTGGTSIAQSFITGMMKCLTAVMGGGGCGGGGGGGVMVRGVGGGGG